MVAVVHGGLKVAQYSVLKLFWQPALCYHFDAVAVLICLSSFNNLSCKFRSLSCIFPVCHYTHRNNSQQVVHTTGAALLENNEASAKLTTANGATFTWAQLDSVANHVTARSIGDWRALTWLATATGWTRRKRSAICSGKLSLSVSTWFDTTWIGGTVSRLYTCKSVIRTVLLSPSSCCRIWSLLSIFVAPDHFPCILGSPSSPAPCCVHCNTCLPTLSFSMSDPSQFHFCRLSCRSTGSLCDSC